LAFFNGNFNIISVFLLPISIRFRYLDRLIANRMAPSMCPDPCGTRWGGWFQAVLYHISAAYLAFVRSKNFLKMPHKTDMPAQLARLLLCIWFGSVEFNTPPRLGRGHFGGGLHSQSLD